MHVIVIALISLYTNVNKNNTNAVHTQLVVCSFPFIPVNTSDGVETQCFICALWSCFLQIILSVPLGLCRDSRQRGCACLIKESDVNKCKHSIFSTRCSALPRICQAAGFSLSCGAICKVGFNWSGQPLHIWCTGMCRDTASLCSAKVCRE